MKKVIFHLFQFLTIILISVFTACNFGTGFGTQNNFPGNDQNNQEPSGTSTYFANESSRNITTDDSASIPFTNKLYINLTDISASSDNSSWFSLSADNQTVLSDSDGKKITASYNISTKEILINSSKSSETLQVIVSGASEQIHLNLENKKEVETGILINNVNILSSGNYPAINYSKKAKVYLQIEGNSSITDGRSYGYGYGKEYSSVSTDTYIDDDGNSVSCTISKNPVREGLDTKATIYSKGPLILSGSGSLTLNENYKHGIYSKDYIRIFCGEWNIKSQGRNGIQCVNGFIMDDGTVTIKGTGTNINNQSRGIIVEGEEDTSYAGEGFVLIKGGSINIETVSKAISAKWDISEDAETTETTDDPYPFVKITGGDIKIKTTGTPCDESKSTYNFTDADGVTVSEKTKLSPEGIEGKVAVFIEGGNLDIQTTDDCINASRSGYAALKVSGGNVYLYSSGNDALDSNGTLTIEGGTIVALTSTIPECAFDCDNYAFSITGGTLIGIGTNNYSKPTSSVTTQSTIVLSGNYLGTAGKTLVIGESSDNPVFAYTIDSTIFANLSSNYIAIISSPEIKTDTSYSVFINSTVTGGSSFNGLYTILPETENGISKAAGIKTTGSSYVYTLSSSSNGGAQEGAHGNPFDGKPN